VKNPMAPNIVMTIVLFAAVAAVALRTVARRPEPGALGTGPAQVTVMTGQSQPPPAVVDQAQYIFHELHPYGRNTSCTVCDSQYESA
jgi:hypothetical protein